jgi:hypothetical protein
MRDANENLLMLMIVIAKRSPTVMVSGALPAMIGWEDSFHSTRRTQRKGTLSEESARSVRQSYRPQAGLNNPLSRERSLKGQEGEMSYKDIKYPEPGTTLKSSTMEVSRSLLRSMI